MEKTLHPIDIKKGEKSLRRTAGSKNLLSWRYFYFNVNMYEKESASNFKIEHITLFLYSRRYRVNEDHHSLL